MSTQQHVVPDEEREKDLIFEILSSPRRRYLLRALHETEGPVATVTGIADAVAALEYGVAVDDVSQVERKRVYVSLYQTHLPKLEESGIVTFDRQNGTIRLTNGAEKVGSYLDVPIRVFPAHYVYLLFGILSTVFLMAVFVDLPVLGSIPDAVAAFLVVASLILLAAAVRVWGDSSLTLPDAVDDEESTDMDESG